MIKKALITGSAKGIGRAIALDLASKGFDVAIHYRKSIDDAKLTQQEALAFGVHAVILQADITNAVQAVALVEKAAQQLNGLSVIVNNVGDYAENLPSAISFEEWQSIMNSNLNATFYITQTAIPYLKKAQWGRIINVACASAQTITARHLNTAYIIAKSGIIIYTKSLAKELAPLHITANIISPGIAENSFDVEDIESTLPLKRAAKLAEIARATWFFIDPNAAYLTGQVLEVSGGWNL